MTRRALLAAGAVALAACAGSGVRTESAVTPTTPTTPTTSTTGAPPATTVGPATTPPGERASTSAGDSLLPELGSADIDVQSYDVQLAYDPATEVLSGTVTMELLVVRPTDELALDAADVDIMGVGVDGVDAPFDHDPPELVVRPHERLEPARPVVVTVSYRDDRHASASPFGLGGGWYATDSGAHTLNEPDGARTWLPSNDHPSDKATWRFELSVPEGYVAVANGAPGEPGPISGTGSTFTWDQAEPMATYLVQVLIGDYTVLDRGTSDAGVPLVDVALTRDVERMQPYFDLTSAQIEFFEPYFGPYPLDRYGLAFVDSEPGLAMEHQGRSLFSRDDFPGGTPDVIAHLLLAHELAHQWFGNAVTPADWGDLWLNESFATYAQWMWLEEAGFTTVEREAETNLALRGTPTEPTGEPSAGNLFGYERYDGGAVVVHALRRELGDDAFFELLRRWVADNDRTSRVSADLIALAEDVAGRSLTTFFDDWLYAPAVPPSYPS